MMKKNVLFILLMLCTIGFSLSAHTYYIAVDGDDNNTGTIAAPFATLNKAQELVQSGDTVYFRGGTYSIKPEQIMTATYENIWAHVFSMSKSGASENQRICYFGYEGERVIFDLSDVKPTDRRVVAFYVSGSNLHFKNFEVVGTQLTLTDGNQQSECFRNDRGNNNIYENLVMRDGMAIGFYLVRGSNNLVLNCDAYNNYDPVSGDGRGGNVDGFGGHPAAGSTGNIFRGCRAWWNSDDGFDLIHAFEAYTIENCWAFYNGYKPGTFDPAGDGTGIKAGGYGMSTPISSAPSTIPMHIVRNNIAAENSNQGLYANHHLGGILWENNTGYRNPANYDMRTRKNWEEAVDVDGYGHIIRHNLSFSPRTAGLHIRMVDQELSQISNNSFLPVNMEVTADDFVSLDITQLMWPRNPDGSLPDIDCLKLKTSSPFYAAGMGYFYTPLGNITSYDWIEEPTIVVEHNVARIVGNGAGRFNSFFVNGTRVPFNTGRVNLTMYEGEIDLRAVTASGDVIRLKVVK
jgi:hypothetical protein